MITKGIRGAITVDNNSKEDLKEATLLLLNEILKQNNISKEDISHVIFTVTDDLNVAFPATFARTELGWDDAEQKQRQDNPSKKEYPYLKKLNSVNGSWQFFPYEILQNQTVLAQGNTGLLFDEKERLQLLNLECRWLSSAHRYLFSLEYQSGICKKIRMSFINTLAK